MMTCDEAREAVSADADGELGAGGRATVTAHLETCVGCRAFARDVARLQRLTRLRPAPVLADRTGAILTAASCTVAPAAQRRRAGVLAAVAAALIPVGALVAATVWGDDEQPPQLSGVTGMVGAAPRSGMTAAYLTVVNDGGADALIGASSADAVQVVLHDTEIHDGATVMARRAAQVIPSRSTTILPPSGSHLMLSDLNRELEPGDRVTVELYFERGRSESVTLPVVDASNIPGSRDGDG